MTNIFGNGHKLHLIDGSGFIFRAYHALPPLTKSDGTPVGAVAGFCNMIFRMIENNSGPNAPTHIAVVFDHKGKTFRSKIYPEYKANRPPAPEDLIPQFELIKQDEIYASYSLWRDQEDYFINWKLPVEKICRFVDALGFPYQGARAYLDNEEIIIDQVESHENVHIHNRDLGKNAFVTNIMPVLGSLYSNNIFEVEDNPIMTMYDKEAKNQFLVA